MVHASSELTLEVSTVHSPRSECRCQCGLLLLMCTVLIVVMMPLLHKGGKETQEGWLQSLRFQVGLPPVAQGVSSGGLVCMPPKRSRVRALWIVLLGGEVVSGGLVHIRLNVRCNHVTRYQTAADLGMSCQR